MKGLSNMPVNNTYHNAANPDVNLMLSHDNVTRDYAIAWHAARTTARYLLDTARTLGLSDSDLESLRIAACEVAPD